MKTACCSRTPVYCRNGPRSSQWRWQRKSSANRRPGLERIPGRHLRQRGGQIGLGLAWLRTPLRRAERHHPPAPLQHGRGDGPEEQGKSRQHVDGLNALVRRPLPVGRGRHRGLLAPVHAWTGDTPQPHGAGQGMRLGRQAHVGAAGAEFGAALADPDGLPTIPHPSCLRQLPCKGRLTAWQPRPANLYPLTPPKARSLLAAALTRRAMPSRQLL